MAKPSKASSRKDPSKESTELGRLEKIFEMMGRHGVAEMEWEKGGERLRLRTAASLQAQQHATHVVHASSPQMHHSAHTAAPALAKAADAAVAATQAPVSNQKQVASPFVGTFYRQASPTAEPYVREGQTFKRGDVLCIIEAMKLMNEIEAEFSGKIVSILVENGQPVEFGEPLFLVEP